MLFCFSLIVLIFVYLTLFSQKIIENSLLKAVEGRYVKSEEKLTQELEAKDAFVSSLSHEVRNPLNSITGSIEYLLQVNKNPMELKMLKNAKLSGELLLNLINNALDAAKLRADNMDVFFAGSDFSEILAKVLMINSGNLSKNGLFVRGFIQESLPKTIRIDSSRILQILMNLVSNAIKFSQKNGKIYIRASWHNESVGKDFLMRPSKFEKKEKLSCQKLSATRESPDNTATQNTAPMLNRCCFSNHDISISEELYEGEIYNKIKRSTFNLHKSVSKSFIQAEDQEDSWTLTRETPSPYNSFNDTLSSRGEKGFLKVEVLDSGVGIQETSMEKVFGMFAQSDQPTASVDGSTGLGLWICKQLIHKMGGDITVYSKMDEGTSFVFYVPVDNTLLPEELPVVDCPIKREVVRALVVDDYEYNRNIHKLLLEKEGVEVELACDGEEAVEKFKSREEGFYDFIFMDIQMPKMNGFEAVQLIKYHERQHNYKGATIYFVSGDYYKEEEVMQRIGEESGMQRNGEVHCVKKPLQATLVRQILNR